jgi:AAA15 family ATPase/GTPase
MITKIKIENFKSIQNLDLELGRLNVFIGANGSGKSNILEGIAFGAAASQNRVDNVSLFSRGLRITKNELIKSAFNNENSKDLVRITLEDNKKDYVNVEIIDVLGWIINMNMSSFRSNRQGEYKANESVIDSLPDNDNSDKNILFIKLLKEKGIKPFWELSEQIKMETNNFFISNDVKNFLIYAPENSCLRNFQDEGAIEPIGIMGEGLFKHLVENKDILETINENLRLLDWFDGFEIPNDLMFTEKRINIKDRYLKNAIEHFDQRSANEGFLYLLFYFTLFISEDTPKFFAIDNIDNAMNPKLGSELIRILAKLSEDHDKQVILTTHNPAILDGLDLEDDSQRLFVISRNKAGHTQAIRVPHRESEERLSTRFIRGSIGGLPKNF